MTVRTDFHAHAFPPGMVPERIHRSRAVSRAARLGRDGGYVDDLVRRMRENIDDPLGDHIRRELEASGFRRAALVGIDWGLVGGEGTELDPEAQLAWARECLARHDGFFAVFYGIDPRRPEVGTLARRALAEPGIAGIKLYPPSGFSPADPCCDPIYEAVSGAGAAAMFHTGRQTYPFDLSFGRLEPYAEVQRRYPDMRIVLGHAGWPFWGREAVEVALGHPTTWIEVSNWHRDLDADLPGVQRFLRRAWAELGPSRVLFGSDAFAGARGASSDVRRWKQVFEETAADAGVDLERAEASIDGLLARG